MPLGNAKFLRPTYYLRTNLNQKDHKGRKKNLKFRLPFEQHYLFSMGEGENSLKIRPKYII